MSRPDRALTSWPSIPRACAAEGPGRLWRRSSPRVKPPASARSVPRGPVLQLGQLDLHADGLAFKRAEHRPGERAAEGGARERLDSRLDVVVGDELRRARQPASAEAYADARVLLKVMDPARVSAVLRDQ